MSIRSVMLALACLGFAAPSDAGSTRLGAQLHFPMPTCDIGDTQLGVDAGVTLTHMENSQVGVGLDLIHHYWPASSSYEAAFDRYLRTSRMEALVGSGWALSALQMTAHVKLVAPTGERYSPWVKVGAGVYRLDLNLDPRRPEGTYAWLEGPGLGNIRAVAGGYGQVGLDFHASSPVVLGVDATLHYVQSGKRSTFGFDGKNDMQDFTAFTVGMHALFGRR